jgi:hypothetical protein
MSGSESSDQRAMFGGNDADDGTGSNAMQSGDTQSGDDTGMLDDEDEETENDGMTATGGMPNL